MLVYLVECCVVKPVEIDMVDQKKQLACVVILTEAGLSTLREEAECFGKSIQAGSGSKGVVDAWGKSSDGYLHQFQQDKFNVLGCSAVVSYDKSGGYEVIDLLFQRLLAVDIRKALSLHDKITRHADNSHRAGMGFSQVEETFHVNGLDVPRPEREDRTLPRRKL